MSEPHFDVQFAQLFDANYERLYRYLDRLSGDAELAGDLAQEAFVRLYHKGTLPERPEAWLVTVALNLFRNDRASSKRRMRLMTDARGRALLSDEQPSEEQAVAAREVRQQVRHALDGMAARERELLLLRAEGYSYRDIAAVLDLNEASVGTLLARARNAFKENYEAT